jgi:Tfp pilus assembly protein PilN
MMLEISKSIPERVWITKLIFKGNKIRIYGIALSNNLVSTFAKNIESSPYFMNLNFGGFSKKNDKGLDVFTFSFSVDFVLSNIKEGV